MITKNCIQLCGHRNWATKLQLAETVLFFVIYASEFFNISGRNIQTTRNHFSVHNYVPSYCMYIQLYFEWKQIFFKTVSIQFCQKQVLVYISTRRQIEKMNVYNMFKHIVSKTNGCDKYTLVFFTYLSYHILIHVLISSNLFS